jgi:hypothetical protein
VVGALELPGQIGEPIWIGYGIRIEVGNDVACRGRHANVASRTETTIRLMNDLELRVLIGDGAGAVGRAVVDDHRLIAGIREFGQ